MPVNLPKGNFRQNPPFLSRLSVICRPTGDGHRRRRARSLVDYQRGDHSGGRERQRAGDVEESVPVQNSRNAARARAADARKRHGDCRGRRRDRNRRTARQKTLDVFRAERHRGTGVVQGAYVKIYC